MKILAVSDIELSIIYSQAITDRFGDIDLLIGCGDLPYYYLEYMISMLDKPLYYVRGNHAPRTVEEGTGGPRTAPWGGFDLHRKVKQDSSGLIMAGIEGSVRYNQGCYQYTQLEMWSFVLRMVPRLLINRMLYGRYLDIFVTHAPPWKIHDQEDLPHHGIKAFLWLIKVFQPAYHLHGHIHIYNQQTRKETLIGDTWVVNTYGHRRIEAQFPWEINKT
jgi:uncharacterized protein